VGRHVCICIERDQIEDAFRALGEKLEGTVGNAA
jgi:hypothetical protein